MADLVELYRPPIYTLTHSSGAKATITQRDDATGPESPWKYVAHGSPRDPHKKGNRGLASADACKTEIEDWWEERYGSRE